MEKSKAQGAEVVGLPYVEITENAPRHVVRSITNNGRGGRETYLFDFKLLKIRPGFNVRKDYGDINELASYIMENGMDGMDPFTVDVLPDGTVYVEQGHRRMKALEVLFGKDLLYKINKPGLRFGCVEAFVNNGEVDERTRLRRQWSSNKSKEYTALEKAELCKRYKDYFGLTNKEIAVELGISRQHVENFLILAAESDQVKQAVKSGNMSATAAVELAKHVKDGDKKNAIAENAVSSGTTVSVTDAKRIQGEGFSDKDNTDRAPKEKSDDAGPVYDESREEIRDCQNVIKLLDKIGSMVRKIGNEQLVMDIDKNIEWAQSSMAKVREWVHKNKKFNKKGT